jgi:assimilatory nitrate reductase catalytic subunit
MRCAVGCGHLHHGVDVGYGIATVRGDITHPSNKGLACQRGIRETKDPVGEWLTRPLVRRNSKLVPTTWENALSTVAERFTTTLSRSHNGLAVLGSGQQTNEAAYALGKLARGGFGTRYYDANTTLCMASAVTAYNDAFGSDAPPCTYDDIEESQTHFVWGANPAVAHPVMFRWVEQSAANGQLIVVDPVETKTASVADEHVSLDPGTDIALARAILARIIERGEIDTVFVDTATDGFERLVAELPSVSESAGVAGVTVDTIDTLAAAFTEPTLVYWGMGINQSALYNR